MQVAEARTRWHESYNPPAAAARRARSQSRSPSRSPSRRRAGGVGRADACTEADGDAVAMMSQQQLLMELAESKAEVRQLREALRVFTASDGGGLPPELEAELEDHRRAVTDLTREIREKDELLLDHDRRAGENEDLIEKHRAALLRTMGNWSAGNTELQCRWAWDSWRNSAHAAVVERKQTEQVQAAIRAAKASAKLALLRAIAELATAGDAPLARATLNAWHAMLVAKKQHAEVQQQRQERVQAVLLQWAGDFAATAPSVCFAGWRRHVEVKRQEAHAEKMRKEHAQFSAQLKRTAVLQVCMALSLKMKEEGRVMTQQVFIHAWREAAVACRATKAMDTERRRTIDAVAENKRHHEAQVLRNFAMFLAASRGALRSNVFYTWRDVKVRAKQARVVDELRIRQAAFSAWHRDTILSRREHELEQEREREQKRVAELLDQQKQRRVMMAFSLMDKSGVRLLQQTLFSSWREATLESKRQREMELEWEKERQHQLEQQRLRRATLAFSISGQLSEQNILLELRTIWSAWNECVKLSRRDRELEGAQRLFEEEKNRVLEEAAEERRLLEEKATEEARRLEAEVARFEAEATAEARRLEIEVARFEADKAELDAKFHDVHMRRKFGFLMSIESRDQNMLMAQVLSCWKESTHHGATAALKDKLAEHAALHASLIAEHGSSLDTLRKELAEAQQEADRHRQEAEKHQQEVETHRQELETHRQELETHRQELEMHRQERLSTSAVSTVPSVHSASSRQEAWMTDAVEDDSELIIVSGAGGLGSSVDGRYNRTGTNSLNGTGFYQKIGGEAIIYCDSFWKMHTSHDIGAWCYSVRNAVGQKPPAGAWTTYGYNGLPRNVEPAPTVTIANSSALVEAESQHSSSTGSAPRKSLLHSIARRCLVCGRHGSGASSRVRPASPTLPPLPTLERADSGAASTPRALPAPLPPPLRRSSAKELLSDK